MHSLVIRNATIVDGTGGPVSHGDVAVDEGFITAVGVVDAEGAEEIDASGLHLTPGFVDIHTHFDGQITWDPTLSPSSWHGVTTVVMGNCGVGFAPADPNRREWLIELMEGVEDIPGAVLSEGMQWNWETFPEYLDFADTLPKAIDTLPKAIDVGTQIPHGPLRAYVMGERGGTGEPASTEDSARMAAIVREAIEAGALGFSSTRSSAHRSIKGDFSPSKHATEDELFAIGRALGDAGRGVIEVAPAGLVGDDLNAPDEEMAWMRRLSAAVRRPISYALVQHDAEPDAWRRMFQLSVDALDDGAQLTAQVAGRPISLLIGIHSRMNPLAFTPTWQARVAPLHPDERLRQLQQADVRSAILGEAAAADTPPFMRFNKLFPMDEAVNYEPEQSESLTERASRAGKAVFELFYDMSLERDGKQLFYLPGFNYHDFNMDAVREMLLHPRSALGLADAGAHCGTICDASMPTFMITFWTRDRTRGERLPLEYVVRKMTKDTAELVGLRDRGTIELGMKADLNLIDMDRLRVGVPEFVHDLPANGGLIQTAEGYVATFVGGEAVSRDGVDTGARPGQLLRGA